MKGQGHCMKCKKKVDIDGQVTVTKNKMKMLKGPCPKCKTTVCCMLGKA